MIKRKCNYFLGIVILIQWVIITHLISQMQINEEQNTEFVLPDHIKDPQTLTAQLSGQSSLLLIHNSSTDGIHTSRDTGSLSNDLYVNSDRRTVNNEQNYSFEQSDTLVSVMSNSSIYHNIVNEESLNKANKFKYEGVATTIMLNAPKWFQKRYSTMISNILTNVPTNWAIQIFYVDDANSQSQFGLYINPNIGRLAAIHDRIIMTPLPNDLVRDLGLRKKVLYWTNDWIWKQIVAEKVLVFTGNAVICSNGQLSLLDGSADRDLFDNLDYLGTPWTTMYGEGGDSGAISFRRKSAMLDAIQYRAYSDGREDIYFIKNLKELNHQKHRKKSYRIATKEQTHLFGGNLHNFTSGLRAPPLPMVISGTLSSIDHDVRQDLLSTCPEVSVLFPVLHHPSCFGAHPDGEECAKHICALKPASERHSGC